MSWALLLGVTCFRYWGCFEVSAGPANLLQWQHSAGYGYS
ncbi:hypothetical protein SCOR_24965 [Sulfidibacter corallicola]